MSIPTIEGTTELQLAGHRRGIALHGLNDLLQLAEIVVKSGLAPRAMSPAAVAIVIQFGLEIGVGPVQALNLWFVTQGKLQWYSKSLLSLIHKHPEYEGLVETFEGTWDGPLPADDYTAHCTLKRRGKPEVTRSFSVKEAKTAGLWKENYLKYPKDMLISKARKRAADAQFSDVVLGLPDESDDIPPEKLEKNGGARELPKVATLIPKEESPPAAAAEALAALKVPPAPGAPHKPKPETVMPKEIILHGEIIRLVEHPDGHLERSDVAELRGHAARVKKAGLKWSDYCNGNPHAMPPATVRGIKERVERDLASLAKHDAEKNAQRKEVVVDAVGK